jgi:hypothetical protein
MVLVVQTAESHEITQFIASPESDGDDMMQV